MLFVLVFRLRPSSSAVVFVSSFAPGQPAYSSFDFSSVWPWSAKLCVMRDPLRLRMTPQQRFRAAERLVKRARQPGLSASRCQELRRIAGNVLICNMIEAKWRLGLLTTLPRPASLRPKVQEMTAHIGRENT